MCNHFLDVIKDLQSLRENWDQIIPHLMDFNNTTFSTRKLQIANRIKKDYFNGDSINQDNLDTFVKVRTFE